MKRPRLLLTGWSGVIGRVLQRGLAEDFVLHGVDLRGEGPQLQIADVADFAQLDAAVAGILPVHCIVHLAGVARGHAPWESILQNNIVGTRNVFEVARRHAVRRVVFASSNQVTGGYERPGRRASGPLGQSIDARSALRPDSDYASSKVFGEALARQYHDLHGIEAICLRIGNVSEADDPSFDERRPRVWLSHRDLVTLVRCSILSEVGFGIYYGVSRNRDRMWDIADAERDLGYASQDDAAAHLMRKPTLHERILPPARAIVRRLLPLRLRKTLARWRGVRRSDHPDVRDFRSFPVQEGLELQAYWRDDGRVRGVCASLQARGDEALRFDCLGGVGHFHIHNKGSWGRRGQRIYFRETQIEHQIERSAFELSRNLSAWLSMNPLASVRRLSPDPEAVEAAVKWMKQQMLELLHEHERGE